MIVFDLDGTLVDSSGEIVAAMDQAWVAVVGDQPFPRERLAIGPPLSDMISRLGPTLTSEQRDRIGAAFRARYDTSDFSATRPYEGIVEAVGTLAAQGHRLCIATNKRRTPTLAILARWFPGRFERVACPDGVWPEDDTVPATKERMLVWLRAVSGGCSLTMVGDTTGDIRAARAAGARSIAVTWGYENSAALATARPDSLVDDVASLCLALQGSND